MLRLTKQHALLAASALALGVVSVHSGAQQSTGYATDVRGAPVKSAFGSCYRTGYWTPAMAIAECDPDLVPKPKPAPTPPPPPVAPPAPPPPPPPPPPPAPKPVTEKVTFAADVFFDFDKSVLKPEGKVALDGLLGKLQGTALEVIIAVGYTDAVGGDAYNQALSVRRADAVKAYLVSKGMEPARIYAEGKGKSNPIATNATGAGRAKNRRVEVEAVGTRTK